MWTQQLWMMGLILGGGLFLTACGEDATETAKACAESELIAQCPPGSQADLSAMAVSECSGELSADFVMQNGAVTGSCAGTGTCSVLCRFDNPCECGVERISTEELVCAACDIGGCGNGTCERGENAETCPRDCGATCVAGQERCDGLHRAVCSQTGNWEQFMCAEGLLCVESGERTECRVMCEDTLWYPDEDRDGFGDSEGGVMSCEAPDGYVANGDDCDDRDESVHPDMVENCNDGRDNNCDNRSDCDDAVCEDESLCEEECSQFCELYRERCDPPSFDVDTCRTQCGDLDSTGGELPSYASPSLECHTLYLNGAHREPRALCSRARIHEENRFCTSRGTIDCLTYCTVVEHSCPGNYNGNHDLCMSGCAYFSGEGTVNDLRVANRAITCRLATIEDVGTLDGIECVDARPGNDRCASVEQFQIDAGELSQGGDVPDSVSAGQHSLFTFSVTARQRQTRVRISQVLGPQIMDRRFESQLNAENEYTVSYPFTEPGDYRAVIEVFLAGMDTWQQTDSLDITINAQP